MQGEKKKWFDEESDSEAGSDEESGSDASTDEEEEVRPPTTNVAIQDQTETNLVNLRRTIYLTIMSSMDFEEAGHKLMKIELGPGQEMEIVTMLIECCSQEKTYLRFAAQPPGVGGLHVENFKLRVIKFAVQFLGIRVMHVRRFQPRVFNSDKI